MVIKNRTNPLTVTLQVVRSGILRNCVSRSTRGGAARAAVRHETGEDRAHQNPAGLKQTTNPARSLHHQHASNREELRACHAEARKSEGGCTNKGSQT